MTRLQAEGLSVQFGARAALKNVSFTLGPGVTGLLGANGAGKSTLVRVLATLQRPSAGQLLWDAESVYARPQRLRQVLGYVPQEVGLYPELTPTEFLHYMAAVKGLSARASDPQTQDLLRELNLEAYAQTPIGSFSGGMRQRVAIAQALLGDPQLLVLDEPTVGLDQDERARFCALIRRLAKDRQVLLATHISSDLEELASDLLVLNAGEVAYHGPREGAPVLQPLSRQYDTGPGPLPGSGPGLTRQPPGLPLETTHG